MPVSRSVVDGHVSRWSEKLARFPTRSPWPKYLFHSCQLEVAVEIIATGALLPRGSVPYLICDVANQGALWNNPDAHDYSRLYFRPRNGFHLKTEGIKPLGSVYRVDPHMSVPIVFAYDLKEILIRPDACFILGNFANTKAIPMDGDSDFLSLPFEDIYHDGPLTDENKAHILNMRMSEVAVRGPISNSLLKYIIFRTQHEAASFKFRLKNRTQIRPAASLVLDNNKAVFFRKGIFIDSIFGHENALHVAFHHPVTETKPSYEVRITRFKSSNPDQTETWSLRPGSWKISSMRVDEKTTFRVDIEGVIAYHGPVANQSVR